MTPEERAVIEAAKAWRIVRRTDHPGALYWRDTPDVREAELKLIAAVDALNVQGCAQVPLDSTKPPAPTSEARTDERGQGGASPLQDEVSAWARLTFPHQTRASILLHVGEEMQELLESQEPEEAADILIGLCSFASLRGFDLMAEARRKLAINRARTWAPPDANGVSRHVKGRTSGHPLSAAEREREAW
jgi:hypothetical protein